MAQAGGPKEEQNPEGQSESDAPEREQVKRAVVSAQPALGDPAADQGSQNAVDDRDGAYDQAGSGDRKPCGTVQECGHPGRDAAHGKGEGSQAEGGRKIGRIAEKSPEGGGVDGLLHAVAGAALGLMAPEAVQDRNDQTGDGADKERCPPSPERAQLPARQIAERRADGNCRVKNGEDSIAFPLGVEIGQDGRSKDAECCLTDAHESLADIEGPIVVNPNGGQSGQAPENCAKDDERLARGTVRQTCVPQAETKYMRSIKRPPSRQVGKRAPSCHGGPVRP